MWRGFLRLSPEETHSALHSAISSSRCVSTVRHFWPRLQAGPKDPWDFILPPPCTPSLFLECSFGASPAGCIPMHPSDPGLNILSSVTLPDPSRQGPQDGRGQTSLPYPAQCRPVRPGAPKGEAGTSAQGTALCRCYANGRGEPGVQPKKKVPFGEWEVGGVPAGLAGAVQSQVSHVDDAHLLAQADHPPQPPGASVLTRPHEDRIGL